MTRDRLLAFSEIERCLGAAALVATRAGRHFAQADGSKAAWLSDVATAMRLPAHEVSARIRRAEIDALSRND